MANELTVTYETAQGQVQLTHDVVRKYLTRGNGSITDSEMMLFVKLCEAQKLNPFTNEAYLVKYGNQPAQTIVSYNAYRRRADGNPNHLYCESGIVVQQRDKIVHKQGACVYPGEKLVGGWCRVFRTRKVGNEYKEVVGAYKEAAFHEYTSGKALWESKPGTMIEKVAISQALREAYPADYEGLYTQEEIDNGYSAPDGNNASTVKQEPTNAEPVTVEAEVVSPDLITRDMYKELMECAHKVLGVDDGDKYVNDFLAENGISRAGQMSREMYEVICKRLVEEVKNRRKVEQPAPQESKGEPISEDLPILAEDEEELPWNENETDSEKFAKL